MPELSSPDIKVVPSQEKSAPPKLEPKPISRRAKEMWQSLRARLSRSNPNTNEALTEIATFPAPEAVTAIPVSQPESLSSTSTQERLLIKTPIEKAVIREFSRSTPEGQQARSKAAENILKLRTESKQAKTQRRDFLTHSAQVFQQSSESAEVEKTELENQVLALRADLAHRSTSWIAKARAFASRDFREETTGIGKRLPRLEGELERRTEITRSVRELNNRELANLEKQFQELSTWYRAHPPGKEALREFYQKQGQVLNTHQENLELQRKKAELEKYKQEHGTVAEVARRGNYIMHGITLTPGGTNNEVLEHFADWRDKLMVIVSENPPLSANTFKERSGPQVLWSQIGVVLREGVIANAGGDLGSVSVSVREKVDVMSPMNIESYQRNLDRTLAGTNTFGSYTELVLEFGARPGAIYINMDQTTNTTFEERGMKFKDPPRDYSDRVGKGTFFGRLDRIDYSEIFETAEFVGLPVVVIKEGIVYESSLSQDGVLVVEKSLSPSEIIAMPTHIPGENLPEIKRRSNSVMKTLAAA